MSHTCGHVSADVQQTAAPVSSRLRDGGDGCGGGAEARLREHRVRRRTDTLERLVIVAYCTKTSHFLFWSLED